MSFIPTSLCCQATDGLAVNKLGEFSGLCNPMASSRENYEASLREQFTKDVLLEVLQEKRCEFERNRREYEELLDIDKIRNEADLIQMKQKYPLYNSLGTSLYLSRFRQNQLNPFKKNTTFSKPISEQ